MYLCRVGVSVRTGIVTLGCCTACVAGSNNRTVTPLLDQLIPDVIYANCRLCETSGAKFTIRPRCPRCGYVSSGLVLSPDNCSLSA